jgi:hypothetical protein
MQANAARPVLNTSGAARLQNRGKKSSLNGDWSMSLGTGGTVGAGMYPAKYSFGINTASCANDFVVFNTGAGTATAAHQIGTFTNTNTQTPAGTVTITNGANSVTLTASTSNSGTNFLVSTSTTNNAAYLAIAIARNGGTVGVTATYSAAVVTVTATTAGTAGNNIVLTEALSAFTWNATRLANGADRTAPQATVVAFGNLYSGCGGTVPSSYWAYNTGIVGIVSTSVVLSANGSQIGFVQTASNSGVASLVLLKSSPGGTVSSPVTPTSVTAANYRLHTAPCMTSLTFNGSPNDTNSPPFYDYANDVIYVGDNNGRLHKFTGVFNGTPAEVTASWPITVSTGITLTGPVYDSVSKNIFVAGSNGLLYYVRDTGSSVGGCGSGTPPCLGTPTLDVGSGSGRPVIDPPLVDSSTKRVFAFIGCSNSTGTTGTCGDPASDRLAQVVQADTALGPVARVNIGAQSGVDNVRVGAFDNVYYNPPLGNYSTAHLYVCGNPRGDQGRILYSVAFNSSGAMTTVIAGPTLTSGGFNDCPIIEVYSGAKDWIFVSVPNLSLNTAGWCAGTAGCVMSFDVTSGSISTSTIPAAHLDESGGTSGIVIDNTVSPSGTPSGTSQIYFSTLTGGTAVQASQAALQ